MKKLFSGIVAAVLTAASFVPFSAYAGSAGSDDYIPSFYMKAESVNGANLLADNILHIPSESLEAGDVKVKVGVYIEDELNGIYYGVSAKWFSDSKFVTMDNLINPTVDTGEERTYTNSLGQSFTTNLTPFAYAKITNDGSMTVPYQITALDKKESNSMAFTYTRMSVNATPFEFLGASSDEFTFTSFDAIINSETPDGIYNINFGTNKTLPNGSDGDWCLLQYYNSKTGNSYPVKSELKHNSLTIIVGDYLLGDADLDGAVNSSDASLVLKTYAESATGIKPSLSDLQNFLADVDSNKVIDSSDASTILAYYAYISTGGTGTIEDFLS